MLMSLNSLLRRHRRRAALALAVVSVAFAGLAAHSALMGPDMDGHMSTAAVCLVVGGCALFIAVAGFATRPLRQRGLWLIAAPALPALPFIRTDAGFLVRAGPPSLSQVFRL